MSRSWKEHLGGGGVQQMNARLTRLLKKRRTAFLLLALFPLGVHRYYLESPRTGLAYVVATLAALALALAGWPLAALSVAALLCAAAVIDAFRVDARVARINKQLRLRAYLGHGAKPPPRYRGRVFPDELQDYLEQKERQTPQADASPAGDETAERPASFAQQERMLSELARRKRQSR